MGLRLVLADSESGDARESPRAFESPRAWAPESQRVLLVEPDTRLRASLHNTIRRLTEIDSDGDFRSARKRLLSKPYGWLITNSRLAAYNGLHLVLLAKNSPTMVRSIVYAARPDPGLAREAQNAGAWWESLDDLSRTLPALLRSQVPPDRQA